VAVVEDVGAKFKGSASCFTLILRWHVEYCANKDSGLPDIPIIGILRSNNNGIKRSNSSVLPELLIVITTSFDVNIPRSPWKASSGFTKNDGVPVLASVAAIFAQIWPDFPTPVMINLPLQ